MQGVVTKSTGNWYQVYVYDKDMEYTARLKGIFRLDGIRDTNPVAVGDSVTLDQEEGDYVIATIDDRRNYIIRQSPKHRALRHVIASNIDQAIVVATIAQPRTSSGFIDRFLVTAEAYSVPSVIVLNKIDVYKAKEQEILNQWTAEYRKIGYTVIETSTITGQGVDILERTIQNKRSLISGHSGVGKSTLINTIDPTLDLRTNEISCKHEKGMHTTTFSELHRMQKQQAEIIDTPGIKEFGILQMEDYELKDCFPEFIPYLNQCKFHNCLHTSEPECQVMKALHSGNIATWRYQNYLNILDDIRDQSAAWELKKRGQ